MSRVVADVVIVGGGIVGCSVAFHLARRRGPRVLLVEKGSLGSGMTKRSGALVHTHFADETCARLARASLRALQNAPEIIGATCGWTTTGLAVVTREDADALRAHVARLRRIGVNTQTLSPAELRELQPHARVDDLALAAFEPDAGFVDPLALTQGFAARAKALGAIFRTGTFAKSIRVEDARVLGVETNVGMIEALAVVVAAGAWSARLLQPLGIEIGLQARRAAVAFFARPPELAGGHAAFLDWTTGAQFRPHTFGLTMGGWLRAADESAHLEPLDEALPPTFVGDLQQRIATRLPAMARARFVRGHAGVYDLAPDELPVLGRAPGVRGLFVAAGMGGAGTTLAPAVGACIAEMIADGEASTVDVRSLGWERFR